MLRKNLLLVATAGIFLAALGFAAYYYLTPIPSAKPTKTVTIELETYQWGYDPSPIRVKVGDIVVLKVRTRDVPHGVVINELDVRVRTVPGQIATASFVADKPGRYVMYCDVFCGSGHPKHKASFIVEA